MGEPSNIPRMEEPKVEDEQIAQLEEQAAGPVESIIRPLRHIGRGYQPGWFYSVDLRDPFIKQHLAAGSLVLVRDAEEPTEEDPAGLDAGVPSTGQELRAPEPGAPEWEAHPVLGGEK